MTDGWDGGGGELPVRRRRGVLVAIVAVLVTVALVGGAIEVAFGGRSGGSTTASSSSTTPTSDLGTSTTVRSTPAGASEMEAIVARISDFVARARDLTFDHPVKVTLLGEDAFQARVRADAVKDEKELTESEGELRALGLLEANVRLLDVLASFLEQGVMGFYDPKTDELVVRGAAITPYVRVTLAHELTHALDDQRFELDRPAVDEADDEQSIAFSSLAEGNAVRVQDAYKASLSKAERADADKEEAQLSRGVDLASIPRVIPELVGFPYIFGPQLISALLDAGGEDEVNRSFNRPPVTTEQVIDPKAWIDGDRSVSPQRVSPPKADGAVVDQGVLGFWGIYVLLEEKLGQRDAASAAKGWGGDWYVAWKRGEQTCVRTTVVMDSGSDLRELTGALDEWAGAQRDAQVSRGDGRVEFTACG